MRKPTARKSRQLRDKYSVVERMTIIYYGLAIARERIFARIDEALDQKKISASSHQGWKLFFENEFASCFSLEIAGYRDSAFLEFKARHLMNTADNLDFDREDPWQGFTVSFENILFPIHKP